VSTLKVKDLDRSLLAKGFKKEATHHNMYWLHLGGKKTGVRTRLSHGETEYRENLISQVAKQLGLTKGELFNFVECTLSGDQYAKLMLDRKIVRQ
jgi:hypothetical protein